MTKPNCKTVCRHWMLLAAAIILLGTCPSWSFDIRQTMGEATEGLMKDYFTETGWKTLPGQVGSQGIDGLFIKKNVNGVIDDVLIAESKYNTSHLGSNLACGNRQMSQNWITCKLDDLIKKESGPNGNPEMVKQYQQIRNHVQHDNYRGRLWHTEMRDGKLNIDVQDVKSKGEALQIERLSGGSRYKIQSSQNELIDLKNPQPGFQRRITDDFYRNLDNTLQSKGISENQRARMMNDFRSHPEKIPTRMQHYASRNITPPQSPRIANSVSPSPKIQPAYKPKISPVVKQVKQGLFKRVVKSIGRNLKSGVAGAAAGSPGGPLAMAAGFVAGVAVGVAQDYVMDKAVDTAFDAFSPEEAQAAPQPAATPESGREAALEMAEQVGQQIQSVQNRMEEEFRILGDDIQLKHDAEMTAIQGNLAQILEVKQMAGRIDQKVDQISQNLSTLGSQIQAGFSSIGDQLSRIDQKLESISQRIDIILDRLDATIKADFANSRDELDRYESTQDIRHLYESLKYVNTFINTLKQMDNGMDEEDLLELAQLTRLTVLSKLYQKERNQGYAKEAVDHFLDMTGSTPNLQAATTAYLCITDADVEGKAAGHLLELYRPYILELIQFGDLDESLQTAQTLAMLTGLNEAEKLNEAVARYIETGQDETGMIGYFDPDYMVLVKYVNGQSVTTDDSTCASIRYIVAGRATADDYIQAVDRYQSAGITRFAIRQLIKNNYYEDALKILGSYPVRDDNLRIKAYLLVYHKMDSPKFRPLLELVLKDQTYPSEVKEFSEQLSY